MTNYRLLIVGASGLVGSNCLRLFSSLPAYEVKGTYFSFPVEGLHFYDTLNPANGDNFDIAAFKPTHILHTGALTHVDYCEKNEEESYQKTVLSTMNLLAQAERFKAKFIYISTDYVFDGSNGPYSEDDIVNPLSLYGRHKLEAEQHVQAYKHGSLIIRVTNVYGEELRNKNFIARLVQAGINQEQLSLKLPHDQYATPVNAWDIARALQLLIENDEKGIYNIASTDYVNRVQLAYKVMSYFPNNKVEITPISTAELKQDAARPLQGGLKACKFLAKFPLFDFGSVDSWMAQTLQKA